MRERPGAGRGERRALLARDQVLVRDPLPLVGARGDPLQAEADDEAVVVLAPGNMRVDLGILAAAVDREADAPSRREPRDEGQELVLRVDRHAVEVGEHIAQAQARLVGDGVLDDGVALDDQARRVVVVGEVADRRVGGAVLALEPRAEVLDEVLDLVHARRVAHADVDAHAVGPEAAEAVDPDPAPVLVEEGAARVARVDRGVRLDAVSVDEVRGAPAVLEAVDPGDDPLGHGRRVVLREEERITHREHAVADADLVRAPHLDEVEAVPPGELAQSNVSARVDPEELRLVELPVVQADEELVVDLGHVEVRDRVAARIDDDARAAALAHRLLVEEAAYARGELRDEGDAPGLGFLRLGLEILVIGARGRRAHGDGDREGPETHVS